MMSAKSERIDQRVLNAMRYETSIGRKAIAISTGLDIEVVGESISRLKRQGYVEVRGAGCSLTDLAHDVCFGGE